MLRSPDGRVLRRLPAAGFGGFDAHWSRDGRLIAYLVGRCRDPNEKLDDACADLWVIRPDGTGRRRLAAEAVDLTVDARPYAWAPEGRHIAYFSATAPFRGEERFAVVVADASGRRARRLALSTDNSVLLWSPDSSHVLCSTFFERLTIARADGSGRLALVTTGETPDWR